MSAYSDFVASLSPLHWWRRGEASGTVAVDQMGTQNGTYVGSPTLGAAGLLNGDPATSMSEDGVNDWMSVPNLALSGSFTLATWFNRVADSSSPHHQMFYCVRGDNGNLYVHNLGFILFQAVKGSDGTMVNYFCPNGSSGPVLNGTINRIVATYDGTTMRVYRNGAEIGTGFAVVLRYTASAQATGLGGQYVGGSYWAKGKFQDDAVWNRALTPTEIAADYAAGTKVYGTGTLASTCTLAATGTKVASGTGTLTGTVTFAKTGNKSTQGTATLALVATLSATGRKVAHGIGSLALTAILSAAGGMIGGVYVRRAGAWVGVNRR